MGSSAHVLRACRFSCAALLDESVQVECEIAAIGDRNRFELAFALALFDAGTLVCVARVRSEPHCLERTEAATLELGGVLDIELAELALDARRKPRCRWP